MEEIKVKLQIDTDKAEDFLSDLAEIANEYDIRADINGSIVSFNVVDLLKINEIERLEE